MRALSLIETTLYLALFGLIFASIMHFSLVVAESNQNADYRNELERTAIFLDENLTQAFIDANSVASDNADYYKDSGRLALSGTGLNIIYSLNEGNLIINRNGNSANLNNPSVLINKFYLEKVLAPNLSVSGVRVTLILQSEKRDSITKTFQSYYSIK